MEGEGKTLIEMTPVSNGSDGTALVNGQDAPKEEVDGFARKKDEPETERLLENDGGSNGNTVTIDSRHDVEAQKLECSKKQKGAVFQVKEELGQKVCKDRVPLWAVLVLIFLLIIGIIFASLGLCTVIYDDVDERFDRTLFHVQRNLNGSFQLPNVNFTEELLEPDSNRTQALAAELKDKLDALYKDSPALGRYFSTSEVTDIRDAPVSASFRLTFLMPIEEAHQLTRFTLSRAMVYNLLRQFLLDQEDRSERDYIEPTSLSLSES